jgi:CPA1 family monovalent cation:H+ antiporter
LPKDSTVEDEISLARKTALNAAIAALGKDASPAAQRLKLEYDEALAHARYGHDPHDTTDNSLRVQVLAKARRALAKLRRSGAIGDDAYRLVEEELDWLDLSAAGGTPG